MGVDQLHCMLQFQLSKWLVSWCSNIEIATPFSYKVRPSATINPFAAASAKTTVLPKL
jgi:hypothetical protein